MTKQRLTIVAVVLCAGLAFLYASGRLAWRSKIVAASLRGELAYLSWRDLAVWLSPSWAKPPQYPPGYEKTEVTRLAQGEEPCSVLWKTPLGTFYGRDEDEWALHLLMFEQVDEQIYQPAAVAIGAGDIVIDVGSHLGTFTRDALRRGAGLVVAFEVNPSTAACFKKTFAADLLRGRVILVEAAASDHEGTLTLTGSGAGATVAAMVTQADAAIEVPATTIDAAVRRLNLSSVDFIKMDIEGSERPALAGAAETLRRFRPRMSICTYHRWDDPLEIPRLVLGIDPLYQVETRRLEVAYFHDRH